MTMYYRGRLALITDEVFEVNFPYRHRYALRELQDIYVVRGGRDLLALGATGLVFVLLVGVGLATPLLRTPQQWLTALVAVMLPAIVGGACGRLRRPRYELRATYRGDSIQLFSTSDAQVFGQVKRALIRAMEAGERW
jgi:hypothetical protein